MFRPALYLMNRASYLQKFSIIFAVFMLPFAWLSMDKLLSLNAELKSTQHELRGVQALQGSLAVYKQSLDLVGLRLVTSARDDSALSQQIGERERALGQAVQALQSWLEQHHFGWSQIHQPATKVIPADVPLGVRYLQLLSAEQDYAAAMKAQAQVSQLSLDKDNQVNRSIDLFLNSILPLYRTLAQTKSYSAYVTAFGYLESAARVSVVGQLSNLDAFAGAQGEGANKDIHQLIATSAAQARDLYQSKIVDGYAANSLYDEASTAHWEQRLREYEPITQALDVATERLLAGVVATLEARIDLNERRLIIWWALLLLVVTVLVYLFIGFYLSVKTSIRTITEATCRLADGDLSHAIQAQARDELGGLADDFNTMRDRMRGLIAEVVSFAESTRSKAAHVSEAAGKSQQGAARQTSELELISTAMAELVRSVHEISRSSHFTSGHAAQASDKCKDGEVQVDKVVRAIEQLFCEMRESIAAIEAVERGSQDIARAVDMIRSVSEQTNLLALNAAIEAARAGEQGRGFAVVADEVRSLATHSQGLTRDIDGTIERLQREVGHAVRRIQATHVRAAEVMQEIQSTAAAFEDITQGMGEIVQHNLQIAAAAEQQTAVVENVERNALAIRVLSSDTTKSANDMVRASDEVLELTGDLHRVVGNFRM